MIISLKAGNYVFAGSRIVEVVKDFEYRKSDTVEAKYLVGHKSVSKFHIAVLKGIPLVLRPCEEFGSSKEKWPLIIEVCGLPMMSMRNDYLQDSCLYVNDQFCIGVFKSGSIIFMGGSTSSEYLHELQISFEQINKVRIPSANLIKFLKETHPLKF